MRKRAGRWAIAAVAAAALGLGCKGVGVDSAAKDESVAARIAPKPLLLSDAPPERAASAIWDFLSRSLLR